VSSSKRRSDEDKTPSEPIRLMSGTALNLHELAATAGQLARSYTQAERSGDQATIGAVGLAVVRLARDLARMGSGIVGAAKRRGA
jgi:hypothetical protein